MYMFLAIVLLCGVELGLCWDQQVDSASLEAHSLDADDDCSADSSCGANLLQHRAKKYERQDEKKDLVPALVDEVYTYGAPATHMPSFRNSATEDGCFPGLRSYTEDQHGPNGFQHQVDAGAMFTKYPHMSISSVCLHWETDSIYTSTRTGGCTRRTTTPTACATSLSMARRWAHKIPSMPLGNSPSRPGGATPASMSRGARWRLACPDGILWDGPTSMGARATRTRCLSYKKETHSIAPSFSRARTP
mmetsp:Transcript_174975/g.561110  ORF Transcript_174975/g.561110 Transcript_174975/m.561110 type:complete len:248 (-) Transcript_174975:393-1136(-)